MNVCVFCSAAEVDPRFQKATEHLGNLLGEAGYGLVFGGFDEGLMGTIAEGFGEEHVEVIGVVPASLLEHRHVADACTKVIPCEALHDRKVIMIAESDAFVAVPGGIGTLDELFTVLAMKMVGECDKPVILLNVDEFFHFTVKQLEEMQSAGFLHKPIDELIYVAATPEDVLKYLKTLSL